MMATNNSNTEATHQPIGRNKLRRRLRLGVLLAAITLVAIVIIKVVAPNESRWLAAEGLEVFYETLDDDKPYDLGPSPKAGLSARQTELALASESAGNWKVHLDESNGVPNSLHQFAYEDTQHPAVVAFREDTESLVPETFDVWEVARRVRALTGHATDYHSNDVAACLTAARAGRGLLCHHYCRIFAGVCSSRGYLTRLVSLSRYGDHFDHAVCEIYLQKPGKWVLVDVDFGLAYQKDGQWLNAVEVQREWRALRDRVQPDMTPDQCEEKFSPYKAHIEQWTDIQLVMFGNEEPQLRAKRFSRSPTGINMELFEFVFLSMRDDYLSGDYPLGHPTKVRQLGFRADGTDELVQICPEAIYQRVSTAYLPIGRCQIEVQKALPGPELQLRFSTRTPRFKNIECRVDGKKWTIVKTTDTHRWPLHAGENRIQIRSVNIAGLRGETTEVVVTQADPAISDI